MRLPDQDLPNNDHQKALMPSVTCSLLLGHCTKSSTQKLHSSHSLESVPSITGNLVHSCMQCAR
eukprot:scaffold217917_cov21-Tisochrysis_lutea.AAC.2